EVSAYVGARLRRAGRRLAVLGRSLGRRGASPLLSDLRARLARPGSRAGRVPGRRQEPAVTAAATGAWRSERALPLRDLRRRQPQAGRIVSPAGLAGRRAREDR